MELTTKSSRRRERAESLELPAGGDNGKPVNDVNTEGGESHLAAQLSKVQSELEQSESKVSNLHKQLQARNKALEEAQMELLTTKSSHRRERAASNGGELPTIPTVDSED